MYFELQHRQMYGNDKSIFLNKYQRVKSLQNYNFIYKNMYTSQNKHRW